MVQTKILMIDPSITYGGWGCYGTDSERSMINHGIAILATIAQNAGYNVKLLDCRNIKGWSEFDTAIKSFSPDIIGIGFRTLDFIPAKKMTIRVKKLISNVITIIGGLHVTVALEDVLNDSDFNRNIDYIVTGEGEVTFLELLNKIKNGIKSERILKGILPNLNDLPFINRDFYDYTFELNKPLWLGKKPCVTMLYSRGCSYNCAFCQPSERLLFGSKKRFKSVDKVIEELRILKEKYKFNYIHFHDDNFIQDINWLEEFIEKFPSENFKCNFVIQTRANQIIKYEKYLEALAKIGLDTVSIGFESGSDRILQFLRKGTTVLQNIRAAKICRKYGLKIIANYMFGVPSETKKEMLATKRLIDAINPEVRSPAVFTPIPGSDLFKYCVDTGIFKDKKDFSNYFRNISNKGIKGVNYRYIRYLSTNFNFIKTFKILLSENKHTAIIKRELKKLLLYRKNYT